MDSVDLAKLDRLFERANVVPLRELYERGDNPPDQIGLRHDVDDRGWPSVWHMAKWEQDRGIESTWYFLHTAPYWGIEMLPVLRDLVTMGHEIGLHNNAVAEGFRTGDDPFGIFSHAKFQLETWSGVEVRTTAAHGDILCHQRGFVNYDMFLECCKPGENPQYFYEYQERRSYRDFGIDYAGDWLPRAAYMSDSGGRWADYPGNPTLDQALRDFPYSGRMIVLQHPDWWPPELYR